MIGHGEGHSIGPLPGIVMQTCQRKPFAKVVIDYFDRRGRPVAPRNGSSVVGDLAGRVGVGESGRQARLQMPTSIPFLLNLDEYVPVRQTACY